MSKSEASGSKVLSGAMTRGGWQLSLLRGVAMLLLGLFAIIAPGKALLVIVLVIGFYLLIDGVITSIAAFRGRGGSSRMAVLGRGALSIIGGLLVLLLPFVFPEAAPTIWAYMLGLTALLVGIIDLVTVARAHREFETKSTMILSGLLLMLLGILLLLLPSLIARDQMAVVGLTIAALGVVSLAAAFIQRRVAKKQQIQFNG
ncbi:MAG: DUF308 domain-containing protein [Anaerolineae bacterium]|nr:DUF308 domain-containing protein [Anaerolineae bacterium]